MSKLKEAYARMKSPRPEVLAKVEYQSHFLGITGVIATSIVLIYKGYWYVIFAFIFSMGASYAQGMAALQKYRLLVSLQPKEQPEDYLKDISFTRRRGKVISYVFGKKFSWLLSGISIVLTFFILNPVTKPWYYSVYYGILVILVYLFLYLVPTYYLAYILYKRKMKSEKGVHTWENQEDLVKLTN